MDEQQPSGPPPRPPSYRYAVTHRTLGPSYSCLWRTEVLEPPPAVDGHEWFLCEIQIARSYEGGLVLVASWQRTAW